MQLSLPKDLNPDSPLFGLLRDAPGLIAIHTGPEHVYIFSNDAHDAALGHRPLLNRPLRQSVPELEGLGIFERFDEVYRTGAPSSIDEMAATLEGDDGPHRGYFNQILKAWRDSDGEIAGVMSFAYDVTPQVEACRRESEARGELEELVSQLRGVDQQRQSWIATMGHEIRNPLAALKYATSLLEACGDHQEARPTIALINRQVHQLTTLADQLLDAARIEADDIELSLEPCNLTELAEQTTREFRGRLSDRQFTVHLPERALWFDGDRVRLRQILSNLMDNAVKFTAPGDAIELRLSLLDDHVLLTLADTGVGISADRLETIFDPFHHSGAPHETADGSLGLGLAIADKLARAHGGRVTVESSGLGEGATFTLTLPFDASFQTDHEETDEMENPTAPNPTRILLVEDNVDVAETTARLLSRHGYRVETAPDGQSGLDQFDSFDPHVVVLDLGLPDIHGHEVAERLRRRAGQGFVLLAMSGYGDTDNVERSREVGFDEHLLKPVTPNILSDTIEEHLADKKRLDAGHQNS